jgi:hypothetical protein
MMTLHNLSTLTRLPHPAYPAHPAHPARVAYTTHPVRHANPAHPAPSMGQVSNMMDTTPPLPQSAGEQGSCGIDPETYSDPGGVEVPDAIMGDTISNHMNW